MMHNNNMPLWQKILDTKTGSINICNGITVDPETILGTFVGLTSSLSDLKASSARKIIKA